jgi:hypothetical protein
MPKRGRNRVEWLRSPLQPYCIMTDSRGYPFKLGDTVIGQASGNSYEIIKKDVGTGYNCRRHRDGHIAPMGIARDGSLHAKHRKDRHHRVGEIIDSNSKLMREAREARLEELQARKSLYA